MARQARWTARQVFIGDEPVDAEATIIATGSRPNVPDIPGVTLPGSATRRIRSGDSASCPEKITIIGGSVMAAEFAYIFQDVREQGNGASRSGFLKNLDRHLRAIASRNWMAWTSGKGTAVTGICGTIAGHGRPVPDGRGREAGTEADAVLLATGLVPNSGMVSGIDKGPGGEILVNDRMQTSVPGIYACGDVAGAPFLTPVARHEGIVAADNILGKSAAHGLLPRSRRPSILAHELAFCGSGGEGGASLALPGRPGRGPTGRCRTAIPGLQRSSPIRHREISPACVPRGRRGSHRRVPRVSHAAAFLCARLRGFHRGPPVIRRDLWPCEVRLGIVQET